MAYLEKAYAKVNLFLDVGDLRPDAYHDLVSLMFETSLHDELSFSLSERGERLDTAFGPFYFEFAQGSALSSHQEHPELELEAWSIVRALKLYLDLCANNGRKPCLSFNTIRLDRNIPAQAGLGGASSDAAALIRAIVKDDEEALAMYEAQLVDIGADVPFSFLGRMALATGRGELLEPLTYSLSSYPMLMVKPDLAVSTGEAFGRYDAAILEGRTFMRSDVAGIKLALEAGRIEDLQILAQNTFVELLDAASKQRISDIISTLYELGASYANMTGSGPTCFAFFVDENQRERALRELQRRYGSSIWLHAAWALN